MWVRVHNRSECFAGFVGDKLISVKYKGIRNWFDDILESTKTVEDQFELLRDIFDRLREGRLSVCFPKPEFRQTGKALVECLGMVIDAFGVGVRPAYGEIEANYTAVATDYRRRCSCFVWKNLLWAVDKFASYVQA